MVTGTARRPAHLPMHRDREEDLARLLGPTILQLTRQFDGTCSARQIHLASIRAMHELRGSIHDEALPEMVGRLVAARLG